MKNFSFELDGDTYWYSRSVACSLFLFIYDQETEDWYILVNQRGAGCPSNVGKWNVPGGYLDFNETLEECAKRECWEETGIDCTEPIRLASISTNPYSKSQTVLCSFYSIMNVRSKDEIVAQFSKEHSENNEISYIDLIPVEELFNMPIAYHNKIAYNHDMMIKEIYTKRVNIPAWKKLLMRVTEKLFKINIRTY